MKCVSCGTKNRSSAKFCRDCGEKLKTSGSSAAAPPARRSKGKTIVALAVTAAAVLAVAGAVLLADSATTVYADEGIVRIGLNEVTDGNAHYFKINAGNKTVKFFVLKAGDGVIRAALDACDVCYKEKKGYRQEGSAMICRNCDNIFPASQINVQRGGCNPVPLSRRIEGGKLVLDARELERGAAYF